MSPARLAATRRAFNKELERLEYGGYRPGETRVSGDVAAQAAHWRTSYEQERVRLAKLAMLYRDLDDEAAHLRKRLEEVPSAPEAGERVPAPAPSRRRRVHHRRRPFEMNGYTLYKGTAARKGGGTRAFYFFAKNKPKQGRAMSVPTGFEVLTTRSGLPVLRRSGGGARGVPPGPRATTRSRASIPRTRPRPTPKVGARRRGMSASQARALAFAREMKVLRGRAKKARGGKGPIRSRRSARELRRKYGYA